MFSKFFFCHFVFLPILSQRCRQEGVIALPFGTRDYLFETGGGITRVAQTLASNMRVNSARVKVGELMFGAPVTAMDASKKIKGELKRQAKNLRGASNILGYKGELKSPNRLTCLFCAHGRNDRHMNA